jgi:hypothetical protein
VRQAIESPPKTKSRWRLAAPLIVTALGFLVLWLGFSVWRSLERHQAAAELRAMGFEAGAPSFWTLLRTNARAIFNPKSRPWHDRVRLMSSPAGNLDAFGPALHRFRPRGVLLGFCSKLEDVTALRGLSNLERLDFYACPKVTNLEIVSEFTELKELTFNDSPALRSLAIIQSGRRLTTLHITNCKALDDLDALRGLTSLRSLFLVGCPAVKDAELLRGLSDLEELDLSGCSSLTNVDGLHGLKKLKTVNLRRCPGLTPEAVAALRAAIPRAQVVPP